MDLQAARQDRGRRQVSGGHESQSAGKRGDDFPTGVNVCVYRVVLRWFFFLPQLSAIGGPYLFIYPCMLIHERN